METPKSRSPQGPTLLPLLHPFAQRQRAADLSAGPGGRAKLGLASGEVLWLLYLPGRAGTFLGVSLGWEFGTAGDDRK